MGCHALLIQHSSEILIKGKVVVQSYILFIYLFYFLTVVDLCRLSLVAVSGAYISLQCVGFLLWWLLLWSTGSRHTGSVVEVLGLSCSATCEISPDQRSPCIAGRILNHWTTREGPIFSFIHMQDGLC